MTLKESFDDHRIAAKIIGTTSPTIVSGRVPMALRKQVQLQCMKLGANESEFVRFAIADTLARHNCLGVIR